MQIRYWRRKLNEYIFNIDGFSVHILLDIPEIPPIKKIKIARESKNIYSYKLEFNDKKIMINAVLKGIELHIRDIKF